jgi:hypothetical protein
VKYQVPGYWGWAQHLDGKRLMIGLKQAQGSFGVEKNYQSERGNNTQFSLSSI